MAGSLNKVQLIGNLGRDPEVRNTQAGDKVVTLNVATTETWKDKHTGDRKEATEWHRVVIFSNGLADIAESYLQKGNKVFIEGKLQTRKWTDQSGQDKYTTEVVLQPYNGKLIMLDRGNGSGNVGSSTGNAAPGGNAPGSDLDDEIPF